MKKIGVCLRSLNLPLRPALALVRRWECAGVELDAAGELLPGKLSQTARREVRHLIQSHELQLTAVRCPLRRGLDIPDQLQQRIEHIQQVMTLAYELGAAIVIVEAGRIPDKDDDPRTLWLLQALTALGQHGDRVGCLLALETGLEAGETLAKFLGRFNAASLAVNYDPANLLMNGFDLYESARQLHNRIVHCHAKDARRSSSSRSAQEVPLGHGDIDWLAMIGLFEEIGYRGWLAVERETGNNRLADVANGVDFLRRLA